MSSPQSSRDVRIGGGRSTFILLAGSTGFTIFGVALIAAPNSNLVSKVVGALTVALFGSFLYLGVRLLRAGCMYVLTADGIRFPYHQWPMLPWSDIQGTRIVTRRGRRYLTVDARNADARVRQMKSGARGARRNLRTGLGLVPVPEQLAPTSLEDLQREIERRRTPTGTATAAPVSQGATILPASITSLPAADFSANLRSTRTVRTIAVANAVWLVATMFRHPAVATARALLLTMAVVLLVGAAALQLHRIVAGLVTIVAAAIILVVVDVTVGHHVAVASRVGYLFFPFCLVLVAVASWPRQRRSPW